MAEVCRMRACLVPGEAGHVFAGVGDNRMLIIDLGEDNPTPEDPDLLARLFEAPRYPTLDADFQNLLSYAGAELARYGSDPLLTRALGGVLIRALHLRLFGEQQPLAASGPLDLERLDAHIVEPGATHHGRRTGPGRLSQPEPFPCAVQDSVGLTPHQYLLKVRLDCAARLLRKAACPWCGSPRNAASPARAR